MNGALLLNRIQSKHELIKGGSHDKSSVNKTHLGHSNHIKCHGAVVAHSNHCLLYLKSFQHAYNDHLKYQERDESAMPVVLYTMLLLLLLVVVMVIHNRHHRITRIAFTA